MKISPLFIFLVSIMIISSIILLISLSNISDSMEKTANNINNFTYDDIDYEENSNKEETKKDPPKMPYQILIIPMVLAIISVFSTIPNFILTTILFYLISDCIPVTQYVLGDRSIKLTKN